MKKFIKSLMSVLTALTLIMTGTLFASAVTVNGDANSDGNVTSQDALFVLQYCVGMSVKNFNKTNADFDKNGSITSNDALQILNYCVGYDVYDTIVKRYNSSIDKFISSFDSCKKTITNDVLQGTAMETGINSGSVLFLKSKSDSDLLNTATLKSADVKSATCVSDKDVYKIEILLKDGKTSYDGSTFTNSSPLSRSGITIDSKNYTDYLTSKGIYNSIISKKGSVDSISETTSDIVINATVNISDGRLQNLNVSFKSSVTAKNYKLSDVSLANANAYTSTSVSVYDIKY